LRFCKLYDFLSILNSNAFKFKFSGTINFTLFPKTTQEISSSNHSTSSKFPIKQAFSDKDNCTWKRPNATYILRDLEYIEESYQGQTYGYYIGNLGFIKDEKITDINFMENEKEEKDKINPVRIELRNNNSFWLVAGYNKENIDFELGVLIFDNTRRGLCNINSKDTSRYNAINLYKFEEVDNV